MLSPYRGNTDLYRFVTTAPVSQCRGLQGDDLNLTSNLPDTACDILTDCRMEITFIGRFTSGRRDTP